MTGRHLFASGRITPSRLITRFARFCAWGNHWFSQMDEVLHEAGAQTTHGLCDKCCLERFDAEIDAMPTPPAA